MSSWDLLDERSETELHKARLLNVEEKPFKRITKRVSAVSSLISKLPDNEAPSDGTLRSTEQLQEDLTLDFAAFDSSIARLQFLHDANARERARYDGDKQRILDECQAVRDRNGQLREQLEGARATLAQRKKFDELADKITSNRLLRPREDQLANLAKLEEECRELERESETYTETWRERRDQFNRIMDEGMLLRRQIRDEKEEVDRREGMNEGTEDDGALPAPTPRPEMQGSATPRPDGADAGLQKEEEEGGAAVTPAGDHLQVPGVSSGRASKAASAAGSVAATPKPEQEEMDHEDDNGEEDGEVSGNEMDTDEAHEASSSSEPETEKMEVDD
ncbi:Tho complex subunit 7/Mft1p [Cordyceps fumosorosea ARSEF 2679]|uniref:Tho complex subunit 7/Mft1p n=1 Tax=Cordyceps fumosorosea (strain ARSEF 2679) TaxID=1081104 RepID=A0A162MZV4_CORFA|nr:Tho complex subunit 7/Mft1p [Cordyceps fumosorosea ARSEF 2679]OAA73229.1 Tho complex subunit 7/Mft1p [Cordyceps fumosorosea ARSEF 2679]